MHYVKLLNYFIEYLSLRLYFKYIIYSKFNLQLLSIFCNYYLITHGGEERHLKVHFILLFKQMFFF